MSILSTRSVLSKEVYNFTAKFNRHLTKPHRSNLREFILGMTVSGKTYLSSIGEVVSSGVTPRKNTERLSNTLERIDIEKLTKAHILAASEQYTKEPVLLLIDGGDLQKPHAKKMELVGDAVDGSNCHRPGKGYPTLACVAYGIESGRKESLFHNVHSTLSENYKSDWNEQRKSLNYLIPFFGNSTQDRIVVEDRGGDDEKRFIYYREEVDISFLTRIKAGNQSRNLCLVIDGEIQKENATVQVIAETIKSQACSARTYHNKKLKRDLTSRIVLQEVRLPNKPELPLFLVLVYTEGMTNPFALLTDIAIHNSAEAWKTFFWYQKRWEVENFFRAIKQNFGAEEFLVRSFKKIQAIAFLVLLTHSFLLKLQSKAEEFLGTVFLFFTEFCRRWQRKKQSHLDVLQFIRDIFQSDYPDFSYRYFSKKTRFSQRFKPREQMRLFDWRRKW